MKHGSSHEKNLEALVAIAAGFIFLYYILKANYLLTIGFVILLVALLSKVLTRIIALGWIKFSELFGLVNSRGILFVVFYVFFTPLALFRRLIGAKKQVSLTTSYIDLNKKYTSKDMENTW